MFQCGDLVVYGIHGVCRILELENRKIDKTKKEYFVLEPIDQKNARFYVPTQNEAAVSKLRPVISQQELTELLKSEDSYTDSWIEDENQRKQYYRNLISSGDRGALIRMVHTLHLRKSALVAAGRKFHLCDENFLRDAQKLLGSEISLVMNIEQEQVGSYVKKIMLEK